MWSDNETTEDLLGFRVHADLILDVIQDQTVLPTTVGVFGDWGSGKSSILQMIYNDLTGGDEDGLKDDTLTLYFNGWVFEGYDDAKAAILESIVKAFENNKKLGPQIKDQTTKLLKSVNWMRIMGFSIKNVAVPLISAHLTGGVSLIPQLVGKLGEFEPSEVTAKLEESGVEDFIKSLVKEGGADEDKFEVVREFRADFAEMLEKSSVKRLVVIIDDLDRCIPDRIIENLEAIKLFLNVEGTAFVIGADQRIVRHAIEHRYNSDKQIDSGNSRIVDDYLEKLIQIPYALPKLSEPEVETYISMLICKKEVSIEEFNKVLLGFSEFRTKDRYSAFGLSNFQSLLQEDDYSNVTRALVSMPSIAPLIAQSLYGNPRQIKRFLNTYILRKRLASVAQIVNFQDDVLGKLMILEYSEPHLFRKLFEWQLVQKGISEEIKQMEELCTDKSPLETIEELKESEHKDWAKPKVVTWLKLDPKFGEIDLSDYFWISRDRLSSSISGTTLVPPAAKNLFNKLSEAPSISVLNTLIDNEMGTLAAHELLAFKDLLCKMLLRDSSKHMHDIFILIIEKRVPDAASLYIECLRKIDIEQIEPAVALRLKELSEPPELIVFLSEYFGDGKSKAAKAYNLRNT